MSQQQRRLSVIAAAMVSRDGGRTCGTATTVKRNNSSTATSSAPSSPPAGSPMLWQFCPRGQDTRYYHHICGSDPLSAERSLPVIVLAGKHDGPTLLVLAGEHGDEYEGMTAIHNLAASMNLDELHGTVVCVVCCSIDSYLADNRWAREDGKNMARCYPGLADGTLTERATFTIQSDFIAATVHAAQQQEHLVSKKPTMMVALHTAGPTCSEVTCVAYNIYAENAQMTATQREAALAMALPSMLVWGHAADTARFIRTAVGAEDSGRTPMWGGYLEQVPALYMETTHMRGGEEEYLHSLRLLLSHLGMTTSDYEFKGAGCPRMFRESTALGSGHVQGGPYNTPHSGLFRPAVQVWAEVDRGDLLGTVYSLLGEPLFECRAVSAGVVIVINHMRHVQAGYFLAVVI